MGRCRIRDKTQKPEDPGSRFHDRDMASGQAYCAKAHIVALERDKHTLNWPILCRLARISVPEGRSSAMMGSFVPNGYQSTVNARNRCDMAEIDFITHLPRLVNA